MARKIKNAPVVIADTIENVAIDHSSQMSSWSEIPADLETIEPPAPELITNLETEVNAADVLSLDPSVTLGELPVTIETAAPNLYEEFGPVIEMSPELETLLERIESEETVLEISADEVQEAPAAIEPQGPTFAEMIATFEEETVMGKAYAISDAVGDRMDYERSANPENANIQRTLKKVQSAFASKAAARVMLATMTSEAFINRSVHEGKRYNVYALGKAADIMKAATDGVLSNAINNACMRSLFAMRGAGLPFTLETAKACASKQYPCDAAIRRHLTRHTVSTSTAPTQASSTMQALVTLGVVKSTGSSKNPTFALTDHPIVAHLEEVLAKAA